MKTKFIVLIGILCIGVMALIVFSYLDDNRAERVNYDPTSITVVAAGDISCYTSQEPIVDGKYSSCNQYATSQLALESKPDLVLPLGDLQYDKGEYDNYINYYESSWGRPGLIDKTRPIPGNHEFKTQNAEGYFRYFSEKGIDFGKDTNGYYSFNLGNWHFIALNSEIDVTQNSEQLEWLRTDLQNNTKLCTLAYYHKPRFSSGDTHGNNIQMQNLWETLTKNNVDVVLNGHDHHYERFYPMDSIGNMDEAGTTEFVVGTGGYKLRGLGAIQNNSAIQIGFSAGIINLTLSKGDYSWNYMPVEGSPGTDTGTQQCN
jgi:3',5'-cyclic AMP phosphodiesterase CpdA